jgi:hypothetical protein
MTRTLRVPRGLRAPALRVVAVLLLVILAGCEAVGLAAPSPTTESPDGTVRLALAAVSDHDYAGLQALTCSLNKEIALVPFLGVSGLINLKSMGIKEREVAGAMAITYSNVSIKEIRRTETEAYVTLEATGTPTIDQTKMRAIVTKVLKAQNSKVTKADIAVAMARLDLTPTKFSTSLTLGKKGTGWLIC